MTHCFIKYIYWPNTNSVSYPVNAKHWYNSCTMLDYRRRRWADVVQMLYKCFVFVGNRPIIQKKLQSEKKIFNPLTAKLFNLNFLPLEVVSR